MLSLSCLFALPKNAEAGVFSFVTGLFASADDGNSTPVDNGTDTNSQNVPVLQAAINVDPNPTKGETDLSIVDGTALETSSGPSGTAVDLNKASSDQISVYTVRDGDNLSVIAKMFNVSPNTILWANNLKSSKDIKKDMNLVILPISGVKYEVKKGDTLKSIASSFKGDVNEIIQFNDLPDGYAPKIGDEIIIPDGEISYPSSSSSGNSLSTPASLVDASGYYMRPIRGGVRTQGLHGACHCAVDLSTGVVGTPVFAAASGRVIVAKLGGWNGGYGNYIVISHPNGTQTLYAHLYSIGVSVGDIVSKGDQIAKMGNTGNSTGPHLHFEIRGAKNPF